MSKLLRFIFSVIILVGISLLLYPLGVMFQNSFYDRATGFSSEAESNIIIVAVDDSSFKDLNRRWPWPRTWIADVIDNLDSTGAKAIGIDISLFDNGFNIEEDIALAKSIKRSGKVALISRWILATDGKETLYEPLDSFRTSSITGFGNLIPDGDGVIRKYDYLHTPRGDIDLIMQSFSYVLYSIWLDGAYPPVGVDDPFLDYYSYEGDAKLDGDYGLEGVRQIDYRILGTLNVPKISFSDILYDDYDKSLVDGKIILIGSMFPESHDQYSASGTNEELMYGVEIHAHALAGLIKGSFPKVSTVSVNIFSIIIVSLFLALIMAIFRFTPAMIMVLVSGIFTIGVTQLIWNSSSNLIPFGFILLPLIPSIPILSIWHFFIENRERRKIKGQFSKFVAPAVVEHIISSPDALRLGGEKKHVTVLFSDIVNFTTMSEEMEPEEIVSILNRYFTLMVDVIFKYEGTINKFIGDAIMAVFGAPVSQKDSEERAVFAALDMVKALEEFNRDQRARGEREIGAGIGIHSGPVVVGNIGSERQMEYTVIGDTVNISSRLEGLTRTHGSIVISDDVYQKISDKIEVETPEPVMVKGKSKPIKIHSVKNKKV